MKRPRPRASTRVLALISPPSLSLALSPFASLLNSPAGLAVLEANMQTEEAIYAGASAARRTLAAENALIKDAPESILMGAFPNNPNFYIGALAAYNNYYFLGDIDDVGVYNRALSAQEIQQLYVGASITQPTVQFSPVPAGRTYTPQFSTDLVSGVWLPLFMLICTLLTLPSR